MNNLVKKKRTLLGIVALSVVALFSFAITAQADMTIHFTLLNSQQSDPNAAWWAGKSNLLFDHNNAGFPGEDDMVWDWWGYNKDFTGSGLYGHYYFSEINFDCHEMTGGGSSGTPNCSVEDYYFKGLPCGYIRCLREPDDARDSTFDLTLSGAAPVYNVDYGDTVEVYGWALVKAIMRHTSDFSFAEPGEGAEASGGTYDSATNVLDAWVNINLDFINPIPSTSSGMSPVDTQEAWMDGFGQKGFIIPNAEFTAWHDGTPPDADKYMVPTYTLGTPPGGYPDEYIETGLEDMGSWLDDLVNDNLGSVWSEIENADYLYVAFSRDNFVIDDGDYASIDSDGIAGNQGKRSVDGANLTTLHPEAWPIIAKTFLNDEVIWIAAGMARYENHLGIDADGNDYFPQEQAQEPYYTGAASGLQALKFFDDYSWPSQADLYNQYHTGTSGEDMNESDLAWMLTDQTNQNPDTARYNFVGFSDPDQDHAIKRMIYWIDYPVPTVAEANAPAHVPTDGAYSNNWKTVRGFVSNKDPWVNWQMPSDLEFYGAWLNDPKVGGMGYNVYQSGDDFRATYNAIEDNYRYVAEPPHDIDLDELDAVLDAIDITYVEGKPNQELAGALNAEKELKLRSASVLRPTISMSKMDVEPREIEELFKKVNWDEVIPSDLLNSPDFKNIYSQTEFNGILRVADMESREDYDLALFSQSKAKDAASVVLIVEDESGKFRQASWTSEDEKYLSEKEALEIARKALGCPNVQPIAIAKDLKPTARSLSPEGRK